MALEGETRSIKVNGVPINNLRYADATAVKAHNVDEVPYRRHISK